jgi:hypothetical protein
MNNSTNPSDPDWMLQLESELDEIRSVLGKLEGDAQKQCALIEAKDAGGINALLESRAQVIGSIEQASERVVPLVASFELECERIEPGRVAELRTLMDEIGASLKSVLASDRKAEESIAGVMAGIQDRISLTRTESAAAHAYHAHGATKPEARFSDRKA